MIIKAIRYEDINRMVDIESKTFKDPWDYKIMYQETQVNARSTYLGLFEHDYLLGFIGYWNMVDYFDIANIAIDPRFQRQGLASILLDRIYDDAIKAKVNNIFLEVSVENSAAIALYEKHDYHIVRRIKNYYTELKEDAYLMQKEIKHD